MIKKILIILSLMTAGLMAEYAIIPMGDIVTVAEYKVCKRRPPISGGTYIERFYNLKGISKEWDSWYWDGCNWQKTTKRCYVPKDSSGEIQAQEIRASNLIDHHTLVMDSVEGMVIVGCSMNSNYNLGDGFNQYNDFKLLLPEESVIRAYAFSRFDGQYHWWLGSDEIIIKKNYPHQW